MAMTLYPKPCQVAREAHLRRMVEEQLSAALKEPSIAALEQALGAAREVRLRVEPITCDTCRYTILSALAPVPGVAGVHVDLAAHMVTVQGDDLQSAMLISALARVQKNGIVVGEE